MIKIYRQSDNIYIVIENAPKSLIKKISSINRYFKLYKDGNRYIIAISNSDKTLEDLAINLIQLVTTQVNKDEKKVTEIPNIIQGKKKEEKPPSVSQMEEVVLPSRIITNNDVNKADGISKANRNLKEIINSKFEELGLKDLDRLFNSKNKKIKLIMSSIAKQTGFETIKDFTSQADKDTTKKAFATLQRLLLKKN